VPPVNSREARTFDCVKVSVGLFAEKALNTSIDRTRRIVDAAPARRTKHKLARPKKPDPCVAIDAERFADLDVMHKRTARETIPKSFADLTLELPKPAKVERQFPGSIPDVHWPSGQWTGGTLQ
jgi:hypothetical protein